MASGGVEWAAPRRDLMEAGAEAVNEIIAEARAEVMTEACEARQIIRDLERQLREARDGDGANGAWNAAIAFVDGSKPPLDGARCRAVPSRNILLANGCPKPPGPRVASRPTAAQV